MAAERKNIQDKVARKENGGEKTGRKSGIREQTGREHVHGAQDHTARGTKIR